MIKNANGAELYVTKNGTAPLDEYIVPEWQADTAYHRDDQVRTEDTTDGTKERKYWRSKVTRQSVSGDSTGESATKAGVLAAAYWEELDPGRIYEVTEYTVDAPTDQTETELLAEDAPRVEFTEGATTIQCTILDNWEGNKTQQVLEQRNTDVYAELRPKGKGTGYQTYKGNARIGASSKSGRSGEKTTLTVTIAFSGDVTIEAQT